MTNQTLDTKTVTDWREVIPVVRPFYESFFGERFPEDLKVEMVPIEEIDAYCKCNRLTGEMKIAFDTVRQVAKTLVHERAHCLFEQYSGVGVKHEQTLASMSMNTPAELSFFRDCLKNYFRYRFLDECIASAVEAVFAFQNSATSMPEEDKITLKADSNFVIDNYASKYDSFDLERGIVDSQEYIVVGAYLGEKYKNDPKLWDKLKQLRTLDDLRRLVNG